MNAELKKTINNNVRLFFNDILLNYPVIFYLVIRCNWLEFERRRFDLVLMKPKLTTKLFCNYI